MVYLIEWDTRARKDLDALDSQVRRRVVTSIDSLEGQPARGRNITPLKGYKDVYRLRVGDWRAGYTLEGDTVTIVAVGHRRDFYRHLSRRLR